MKREIYFIIQSKVILINEETFIVVNVDWFFLSHRLPIAVSAQNNGYDVTILAKDTGRRIDIEKHGLNFINIPFERSGSNPFQELNCINILRKIYVKEKPDVIHHVTLKAAIIGSIAAKLAKNKNVVNAISGFGYNFTRERDGLKQKIIKRMMLLAFKSDKFHYIFQNPDDIIQFRLFEYASEPQIHLIKGSGVDLQKFHYCKEILKERVHLLLPARMLYDKGVVEFVNAAKIIKERVEHQAVFLLAGDCDTINLAGISEDKLKTMIDGEYIQWIGFQSDIISVLENCDIVVLPSYREGLPKSLIEACAVGRPIITTDTHGCRECVLDEFNGYLVPVRDVEYLAERMEILIKDPAKRDRMGRNSRTMAEKEFSIDFVIKEHLAIYKQIQSN